jgi:signal transduction histidine kinase
VTLSAGARRVPLAGEVVLALAAGAAAFAGISVVLAATESDLFAFLFGAGCIAAIVAVARVWGMAPAAPVAMATLLAYDWFQFPPTHPHRFPGAADLADLFAYLGVAVLIGELAAHAGRRADVTEVARSELAGEQAALRRVATLVAQRVAPEEIFAAVACELGQLLGVDATHMGRYDTDGTVTGVGSWSRTGDHIPVGTRVVVDGKNVTAIVYRTGRPARLDSYADASGTVLDVLRPQDIRSSVGAPIVVGGQLWGVIIASSKKEEPLPPDTESRMAGFTELVATAISNTEAWAAAQSLAEEQAALRRVATFVALNVAPSELFGAVAREVGVLLGADFAGMIRYEDDTTVTPVAVWAAAGEHPPVPDRFRTEAGDPTTMIAETERPARVDDWTAVPGPIAAFVREELGVRSSVGCPIMLEGRLWGALAIHSKQPAPLAPDTESRITQFTGLVATAIANAEARTEVERLADEQAALRRVATLVAEGASPSAVFGAVAAEMEGLLCADGVTVSRYEPDDEVTVVAHIGPNASRVPPGTRVKHAGDNVTTLVRRSERPARMEHYEGTEGAIAELVRTLGVRASVAAPIVVDGRLWGVVIANWRTEESPPPDTEQRMAQFAQVLDAAIANADSRDQLAASRARLVATWDEARRRVVRDLHDGAQQRLIHTIVALKLAQRALRPENGDAASLMDEALEHAERGNVELRELAHGILPAVLTRGGLPAGVDALVSRLDLPVAVDVPAERYPTEVEANAYFFVAEALTNVVKHSHATRAEIRARAVDGALEVEVRDDGVGGADAGGHGLLGMADRVTALGGRLAIDSPPRGGTRLAATLPL